jgi:hypothetical protein
MIGAIEKGRQRERTGLVNIPFIEENRFCGMSPPVVGIFAYSLDISHLSFLRESGKRGGGRKLSYSLRNAHFLQKLPFNVVFN